MANYYTLFSAEIENLTAQEKAWLKEILSIDIDGMTDEEVEEWYEHGRDGVMPSQFCPEIWPGFDFEFQSDDSLWIYSEESGDMENVAEVVQVFLQRFRPDQCWSMEYSLGCSKPRTDAYGGGAVFVTANGCEFYDAGMWLVQQEKAFKEA